MKSLKIYISLLLLMLPLLILSQTAALLNNVTMDESVASVSKKMSVIAKESNRIIIEDPTFPLAKAKEAHLVYSNIKTKNGILEKAVFTFADDQLKYIIAKGNIEKVLTEKRKDTAMTYMDYNVYWSDKLFINKKKGVAWILSDEAMHPNLFTWVNPYLNNESELAKKTTDSSLVSSFLKMGAKMDELKPVFEKNSDFIAVQELDGSDPNAQTQINCFGVDYLGFPRKVEARFGDGKLNVVWILTGKGDEDRIRKALTKQYGAPIFTNEKWEIFNDWQVGLRKDKPEVLLVEKKIGQQYKGLIMKKD